MAEKTQMGSVVPVGLCEVFGLGPLAAGFNLQTVGVRIADPDIPSCTPKNHQDLPPSIPDGPSMIYAYINYVRHQHGGHVPAHRGEKACTVIRTRPCSTKSRGKSNVRVSCCSSQAVWVTVLGDFLQLLLATILAPTLR